MEKETNERPYAKDIAKALDMSSTQFSNAKARNSIPYEKIAEFCAIKKINMNWVLFGQNIGMLKDEYEEYCRIKMPDSIKAGAGGGAFNEESDDYTYLTIDPIYRDMLGIQRTDEIEAIRVIGNSMEDTLAEGSIILVNRKKTEPVDGSIFVVNTPGGVFVKRIGINPAGGIDLKSDNKDFETVTIHADELSVIGRVIGALEKI
ncbi:MAG: hypothetical protein F7B11_01445 [Caldisphaeraceae archaeon]|nr:hypothetical protein [Caldisphaeraceae archaeon]